MLTDDGHNHILGREEERDGAYTIRWKSGKRVDPRLLTLLESFRDVFAKREELVKKMFPGIYEEFMHVFGKFGEMKGKNRETKARAVQRSLSLGSPRELRLERFKIKTPDVMVVARPEDQGAHVISNNINGSEISG